LFISNQSIISAGPGLEPGNCEDGWHGNGYDNNSATD